MTQTLRVAGVDWAAKPKDRALVGLRFDRERRAISVESVVPRVDDATFIDAVRSGGYSCVAVDVPFGWPAAFADFVQRWSCTERRPELLVPEYEPFAFRRTDLVVRPIKPPLSVSSQLLALATLTWVRLVSAHGIHAHIDVHAERPAVRPNIIEVYPGATLATLVTSDALAIDRYKKDAAVRVALVDRLMEIFRIEGITPDLRSTLVGKGKQAHATDALVAAITAMIYEGVLDQRVRRPTTEEEKRDAPREGWIFFPT